MLQQRIPKGKKLEYLQFGYQQDESQPAVGQDSWAAFVPWSLQCCCSLPSSMLRAQLVNAMATQGGHGLVGDDSRRHQSPWMVEVSVDFGCPLEQCLSRPQRSSKNGGGTAQDTRPRHVSGPQVIAGLATYLLGRDPRTEDGTHRVTSGQGDGL